MMNRILFKHIKYIIPAVVLMLSFSCTGLGVLEEGQKLYTGPEIKIEDATLNKKEKKSLESGYENVVTPDPNPKLLWMRPGVSFYNLGGKSEKGLGKWIKDKLGVKPVLLRDVDQEFNRDILVNYSQNRGYFNAEAYSEVKEKGKTAKVRYTVYPGNQYRIGEVQFPDDTMKICQEINRLKSETLLKPGRAYNLETIKSERVRIDKDLKENGFYFFSPDDLIVKADSAVSQDHRVDLDLQFKKGISHIAKQQWTIDKVIVYPDFDLTDEKRFGSIYERDLDTTDLYKGFYIIDPDKKFNPKIFDKSLHFNPGDIYNRSNHALSLERLMNLDVYKFVKNEFVVSDSNNYKLDAYYLLTPRRIQSLRLEALGKVNSADYTGGELNLNWTHRNIFKGAEQLKVAAYGGFEFQTGGPKNGSDLLTLGLRSNLVFPRLIVPFFDFHTSSKYLPRTIISLGYEMQRRTKQYTLRNFTGSFGYLWKENERKEHQLNPIDITYVRSQDVTKEFLENAENSPALQRMIQKQLIFGPTYSYTYSNKMYPKKHNIYYKGDIEFAGNLTGLLMGADTKNGKTKEILGVPFSQFIRTEHDLRWYYKIDKKQNLVARANVGLAYPYGNSEHIPFVRQFFAGGVNSIRAFRARTLGPGSFDPSNLTGDFYFDESGDIKMEFNLEYRANLYKFLNIAAFIDAGNVWLINSDEDKPGGKFSSDFLSEFAVGAGLGLRFDFSILVLRTDFAVPLRIPYYPKNNRWTFDKDHLGSGRWISDNMIFNLAIGYPF